MILCWGESHKLWPKEDFREQYGSLKGRDLKAGMVSTA